MTKDKPVRAGKAYAHDRNKPVARDAAAPMTRNTPVRAGEAAQKIGGAHDLVSWDRNRFPCPAQGIGVFMRTAYVG